MIAMDHSEMENWTTMENRKNEQNQKQKEWKNNLISIGAPVERHIIYEHYLTKKKHLAKGAYQKCT